MDARLLRLYEEELRFLRSAGVEFREQYPKIAGRLGIETERCTDPYVERLLEGVAFLAARVQLKLKSRFPDFTQQLLELLYPHLIHPTPSTGILAIEPLWEEGAVAAGVHIPARSMVRAPKPRGQVTACRFRTAHDVTLWPFALREAEYLRNPGVVAAHGIAVPNGCRSGLRLRFESVAGLPVDVSRLRNLPVYLRGADGDEVPMRLYELLLAGPTVVAVRNGPGEEARVAVGCQPAPMGFDREQAMLPSSYRVFDGYRLLQEYFTLPQRFLYVQLPTPLELLGRKSVTGFELILLFPRMDDALTHEIDANRFVLYSTPIVNLIEHTADRIHLVPEATEYHVVPDRSCPLDLEVHSVSRVTGIGAKAGVVREFEPMFRSDHLAVPGAPRAWYSTSRTPRIESSARRRRRGAAGYLGSEVFVSLHDPGAGEYGADLRQLQVQVLCTNRGLPQDIAQGPEVEFGFEGGEPVRRAVLVQGLTRPKPPLHSADTAWKAISHLTPNYLSLVDSNDGAEALRGLLSLYVDSGDLDVARRLYGLSSVASQSIVRRMPVRGPLCFGSGLQVRLRFDEDAFVGSGAFLLASVLERFLAGYVALNSFVETVFESQQRGEVHHWNARSGERILA